MIGFPGWWLLPLGITIAAFVRHFWAFRNDDIGEDQILATAWLFSFMEALTISLAVWLMWAVAVVVGAR